MRRADRFRPSRPHDAVSTANALQALRRSTHRASAAAALHRRKRGRADGDLASVGRSSGAGLRRSRADSGGMPAAHGSIPPHPRAMRAGMGVAGGRRADQDGARAVRGSRTERVELHGAVHRVDERELARRRGRRPAGLSGERHGATTARGEALWDELGNKDVEQKWSRVSPGVTACRASDMRSIPMATCVRRICCRGSCRVILNGKDDRYREHARRPEALARSRAGGVTQTFAASRRRCIRPVRARPLDRLDRARAGAARAIRSHPAACGLYGACQTAPGRILSISRTGGKTANNATGSAERRHACGFLQE